MLTEKRYELILDLLEDRKTITVLELKDLLGTSESTIRRDLSALDQAGKLTKVFGGAVALENTFSTYEPSVAQKEGIRIDEKKRIARLAASLILPESFVYLDAGTTTGYMLDYIAERSAVYVTNAVSHAKRLAATGFRVLLIGGELKGVTEAVIGTQAILSLQDFHFTRAFFGANGISKKEGFTTPDLNEALVKKTAFQQTQKAYVLADASKFGNVSSVTFAPFAYAEILTDQKPFGDFLESKNIRVVP
ncbi:MAG: DeoR/GlpR family DNA-binding transcription regulator [Lachnospiraceae bacterium]|nr:DeoR/GlpR family DNA-binding transcription regulator [Lachnospiraceae bacterium]